MAYFQFVSLVNPAITVEIGILRDCYESFAMYCFGRYLVACLGGEKRTIAFMKREGCAGSKMPLLEHGSEKGIVKHHFPMNYIFKPWKLVQMGIASVVHLYVFSAKPYELMGECFTGDVTVLGDYVSADLPVDPDEVRDSERRPKLRLPQPDIDDRGGTTIRESVKDIFIGGGEYIVNDLKFTVTQVVEPVEKGIQKLHKISQNIKKHDKWRKTKDDSAPTRRVIRGIDDPLLNGSVSDSGTKRRKKHRKKSEYTSAESGGESSSEQNFGAIQVRDQWWVTKD
ncbi:hypothetical protein K7X08_027305 [Anisodus acutangulus]|uniref:Uncharacterized protein n=1 Tax=Anisodus acutangulus TaxID=402998 RepID=A0A9Q1MIP5_9SOLA|nr:hypothetical protein K7X08_027305 [Anisodus acutangulus]